MGLEKNLRYEGFTVLSDSDGEKGLETAIDQSPDLILLDIMLPGLDGYSILKTLRKHGIEIPVIALTAKDRESDKIEGLQLGADDYITKPFSLRELIARIHAVLRRMKKSEVKEETRTAFGDVEVDFEAMSVRRGEEAIDLTTREFRLLQFLVENTGRALERKEILDRILGLRLLRHQPDDRQLHQPASPEAGDRSEPATVHPGPSGASATSSVETTCHEPPDHRDRPPGPRAGRGARRVQPQLLPAPTARSTATRGPTFTRTIGPRKVPTTTTTTRTTASSTGSTTEPRREPTMTTKRLLALVLFAALIAAVVVMAGCERTNYAPTARTYELSPEQSYTYSYWTEHSYYRNDARAEYHTHRYYE